MTTTAGTVRVPAPKAVRDLLVDLLDREVRLAPAKPFVPGPWDPGTHAVYVDDQLVTRAVVICDVPFSAYAGAAVGLVPLGRVRDAIKELTLPRVVADGLDRLLDEAASLLTPAGAPGVRLYGVHAIGQLPPHHVTAYTQVLGRRLDLSVEIAGYGRGRLSVVVLG